MPKYPAPKRRRMTGPVSYKKKNQMVVRKFPTPEAKTHDITIVDLEYMSSGAMTTNRYTELATIPQGVDYNDRVSRKINLKSIQCRFRIEALSAAPTTITTRLIWGPKQQNLAPVINTLYEDNSSNDFMNLDVQGKFFVLKEWNHVLGTSNPGSNVSQQVFENYFLDLKNKEIVYDKDQPDGSLIDSGAFYLVGYGENPTTANAELNGKIRLKYYDN